MPRSEHLLNDLIKDQIKYLMIVKCTIICTMYFCQVYDKMDIWYYKVYVKLYLYIVQLFVLSRKKWSVCIFGIWAVRRQICAVWRCKNDSMISLLLLELITGAFCGLDVHLLIFWYIHFVHFWWIICRFDLV